MNNDMYIICICPEIISLIEVQLAVMVENIPLVSTLVIRWTHSANPEKKRIDTSEFEDMYF